MKTFSISDIGKKRESNQDYAFTSERPVGNLPNLFLVADGMGGHNAGDYASRYTVERVVQLVKQSTAKDPKEILQEAITQTNREVIQLAEERIERKGMGTTLVAMTLIDHEMVIANVGDSRLYVIGEEIKQITRDHSLVQEMVRLGELNQETAKAHPDKNIITRAIGAEPNIKIDFFQRKLKENEEVLMCTDGLTNMVEDEEIRRIYKGQRDSVEKAEKLVQKANENGGRDNITVVVIEPFSDEVK